MLVGLSGFLAGYNGSFEFKSGEMYPEEVNYVFMRVFNAVFGVLCVPLIFYTARALNYSNRAVYLVTLMVLCGILSFSTADVRKLVCYDQSIYIVGFHVTLLHCHYDVFTSQVS